MEREIRTNEYGQVANPDVARDMAYAEKPYREGEHAAPKETIRMGEKIAEQVGIKSQAKAEGDPEQKREDALEEAKRAGNEALEAGEDPKTALTAFLMVLRRQEVLHPTDTTLALCILEAGASKEDVELFINGH